jgi:3-methyladenine DNA glycosylase/8-oxoguanine DNA glycosylase
MELLIDSAIKYENYYKQPINPIFHVACGCICGQQVAFNIGRNIRSSLYKLCGFPLTRESILSNDLSQIKNLTNSRIELIRNMANVDDNRSNIEILNDYNNLNGFGKWTVNAVSILLNINDNINLSSDAYIRKNLKLYTELKMTEKDCFNYISKAENNQTKVCYLLWRIKPLSINKLKNNDILTKDDFV